MTSICGSLYDKFIAIIAMESDEFTNKMVCNISINCDPNWAEQITWRKKWPNKIETLFFLDLPIDFDDFEAIIAFIAFIVECFVSVHLVRLICWCMSVCRWCRWQKKRLPNNFSYKMDGMDGMINAKFSEMNQMNKYCWLNNWKKVLLWYRWHDSNPNDAKMKKIEGKQQNAQK